ncbi:OppA1 [Treponema primitia ZAS-2]|uniref:OppA1 n=1 Tax=Treponema primitia (strain ATCC BAA-887 / DSM 12427 / ZAS-2) TaxID=545694 RepID=F5YIR4_TREPZ|nr:ABC transporter substrate-binding protein [Treponema primitia]AEF85887.1 OppA1 [Treponema primitia ZAS-2]
MKKLPCLLVLPVLCTALAFAGGKADQGKGVTFTIALSEDIRAVDPGVAWNFVTNQVTNQITEGLLTLDAGNNIVPELAKSWRQTDDLTYVYEVRDDIVFSDGTKMTMDDVVFSLERYRNPDGGTYFADFYADVASISATGPWQLTIKLSQPSAIFKYIPAIGSGRIISKAYYEKHADDFGSAQGGIIATGPFVYQSWTSGQEIVLKKNTNYWDKAKLASNIVDTLVYKVIPDDTTRIIALQTGSVDFSANLPPDQLDQLASDKNVTLTIVDSYRLSFLSMNTQRAPFNDVNVRKAISHALNLSEFQRTIIKNTGTLGTVLPFGSALYGSDASKWQQYLQKTGSYNYDLAQARQSLAQSGYPNGFNCNVIVSDSSVDNQRALFLQEALKPLNINVEIRRVSGDEQDTYQMGSILDANGKRDYDMLFGNWEADYPDLNSNIEILFASGQAGEDGYNSSAYANPRIDELIEAQRTTIDPARRFEIQTQFMDIVVSDVPYIVFDYSNRHSALNKKYTGLEVTPAWLWVLPVQNLKAAK